MADHVDGSIIVNTELDTTGFRAGSAELQRAIKSLNSRVEALGPTFQKALAGNSSAMSAFSAKVAALEDDIAQREERLASLGKEVVPTEEFKWLAAEIEKAKNELVKLEEKAEKMNSLGVNKSSQSWKNLQYDISLAKRKIEDYENQQSIMRNEGTAFQMGTDTAEYAQLEGALAAAKERLAAMRSEADGAGQATSRLGTIAQGVKTAIVGIGKVGVAGFKKLVSGIKSAITHLKSFRKSSGGAEGAIGKLGKKLTGLWSMFKRMALRKILMSIITGLKDSVNNLARYSTGVNANLSKLKSGLTQLKNSFATAFAPILTTVTPVLVKLINYLSSAVTWVGKLLAALTGAKTFTKATAVQENYADSLDKTKKKAKEAKRQLAGFDELNILSDNSSDNEDDKDGLSPSEMFEEVPIESSITNFIDRLKNAFKSGNFAEIGKILADKLNSAVSSVNWNALGKKIGYYLNGALTTLATFIKRFDWLQLGANLAKGVNGILNSVDWGNLGTVLSGKIRAILLTAAGFLLNLDWKALADGFSSFAKSFFNGITEAMTAVNWQQIGRNVATFLRSVDWSGISDALFKGIGAVLGGLTAFLWGLIEHAWESVVKWWYDVAYEDGEFTIKGLLLGIGEALKNIGTWILDHVFKPFIDGFKEAFGIASPSTVMAEQGNYIIEGLLQGITGAWKAIVSFFSTTLTGIADTIKSAWNGIKTYTASVWNDVKAKLHTVWSGIKTSLSNVWGGIRETAASTWSSIKSSIANQGWQSVGSNICKGIRDGINAGWDWLTNTVKNLAGSLFNAAKAALGIHSPSKLFRDEIGLNLGYGIGEGIEESQPSILKTVSGVANAIVDEMNGGAYSIGQIGIDTEGNVTRSLNGFSDTITDSFTSLLNRLQSIADNVTFAVPRVTCAAVPYGVSAAASSGKTSGNLNDTIETTSDEIVAAVAQGLASQTAALISAIERNCPTFSIDGDRITDTVIKGINRRARMSGASPITIR